VPLTQHLLSLEITPIPALPYRPIDRPPDQIVVPDHLRPILLGNEQFAVRAVAAGLVQAQDDRPLDMNDERELAQLGLSTALRAGGEADIRERVEEEVVASLLLAESRSVLTFPWRRY